jgi:predicted DCC family thiol-disulfide oxidoreductase YuxK
VNVLGGRNRKNSMSRYRLAYDADCGPCTKFKRAIGFLDSYHRISPISLVEADSLGMLDKVPAARRHRSFHLVAPNGEILSGAEAIPTLVRLLPGGRVPSKLMASAPGGPWAVKFVYQTFSRLHDSGSCSYRPGSGMRDSVRKELRDAAVPRFSPAMPTAPS